MGELKLDSEEEEEGDKSPLWVLVRDFLNSADVLVMRTTGLKWNVARLYGSFAEFRFFLIKKKKIINQSSSHSGPA